MPSEPTDKTTNSCEKCNKPLNLGGFCVACHYDSTKTKSTSRKWQHRLSNIDQVNKTADCEKCGSVTVYRRENGKWRCANASRVRAKEYKRSYRESKKALLLDHCQICGTKEKLCWDHDHTTGKFRGTLCSSCNIGIGHLRDDIQILLNAIKYLNKHDQSSSL